MSNIMCKSTSTCSLLSCFPVTVQKQDAGDKDLKVSGVASDKCCHVLDHAMVAVAACSPSSARASLGVDCDHVVALGWRHSLACVLLAINLVLHKEMSLLFKIDVAVGAGVALRVTELGSQLYHHSPDGRIKINK